jgi:hypothetical protein
MPEPIRRQPYSPGLDLPAYTTQQRRDLLDALLAACAVARRPDVLAVRRLCLARALPCLGPWEAGELTPDVMRALYDGALPWLLLNPGLPELRIADANAAAAELIGAPRISRLIGTPYVDCLAREWRGYANEHGQAPVVRGDTGLYFYREIRHRTGSSTPIIVSATPVCSAWAVRRYLFVTLAPAAREHPAIVAAAIARGGAPVHTRRFALAARVEQRAQERAKEARRWIRPGRAR